MKIEADIKSLKKILVDDENFYQVPDYQRPYSWDKDNLSDLIDDLVDAFVSNRDDTYFCGSLVLVKNNSDLRFDIIDGQQRTTTFTIMACIFRDVYSDKLSQKAKDFISNSIQDKYENSKRKLKFLTNEKYQIDFEETVLKGIDFKKYKGIEKVFNDNRYFENAHHLKDFIDEQITEKKVDINDFVIWFYENIVLTVITCPSQDSAIQIFTVLNDRGMPLSPIDILKSKLMQKLDNEDRIAFKTKWESINENLKFVNFDLDGMLTTYLYYKLSTKPKSRLDKELWMIFDKEKKTSLEIIKEISDFSKSYIEILTLNDKHIYCLMYLQHKIYWNSILSTALFSKYPHIEELKELLVAYYYQNWIAGATVARIKQTSLNILKLVKAGEDIKRISEEASRNLKIYSTTSTFKEEISGSWVYGRKWDKAILLLVEYFLSDNNKQSYIYIGNNLHLEHILPQTPNAEWKKIFNAKEIETWSNSLANLTLLSMRKNIQAKNYPFNKKIEAYENKDNVISSFLLTQEVIKCSQWNVSELEKRKNYLLEKIMKKIDIF